MSCVRFSPDETQIISTSKDDNLKVWDVRQQTLQHTFEHPHFKVGSAQLKFCISPDSRYVVCGTKEGGVVFYDAKKGECENIISDEHKSQVVCCAW